MSEPGHILVVDDDRMSRLMLFHAVRQLGHSAEAAENGRQALEMLRSSPFDLVLLDIVMPEMDGFEVLEQIKGDADLREIPVVVVSGLEELESAARCIELGAEDYLTKPTKSVLLNARLTASLEKKQYRDLERAYLQQEIMLRQNEKLATLGRLAAGMAHELNNPVAAAERGVENLSSIVEELRQVHVRLGEAGLTSHQHERLANLGVRTAQQAYQPRKLDPLAYSELESTIEGYLASHGVDRPWEHAASLVDIGYDIDDLDALLEHFSSFQMPAVIAWLAGTSTLFSLLDEIQQGLQKITQTIQALKSYSYLDQAPVQFINVQDGLESTLQVLSISTNDQIVVRREYTDDLPQVEAYGSELNQVWSNILDNAVAAMGDSGELTLRILHDADSVCVEIEDNGHGIPAEIQSRIFDPFFTTRPPGESAGLGLTLSHNVIKKHGGTIQVHSEPGSTRFIVQLPVQSPELAGHPEPQPETTSTTVPTIP